MKMTDDGSFVEVGMNGDPIATITSYEGEDTTIDDLVGYAGIWK